MMSTWSDFPSKARWTASTISQTPFMPLTASLLNRPCSSTPSYVRSPRIWSHCVPTAANLALENVAQKTINYLPILVVKCTPYHIETVRRINPKCALSSRHSGLPSTLEEWGDPSGNRYRIELDKKLLEATLKVDLRSFARRFSDLCGGYMK